MFSSQPFCTYLTAMGRRGYYNENKYKLHKLFGSEETMNSENMTFEFWDKYMHLEQEELKLFNFVLQFDFGDGNAEYSHDELKAANLPLEQVLGCLKVIICGYNDGAQNLLAFLDIDEEGGVGYNFFREGSEEPVEVEDAEIVAANIYAIVSDCLVENFDN